MQKTYLTIAAAVTSIACATAGAAAELPSYETKGFADVGGAASRVGSR